MRCDVQQQGARDPHDILGVPRGADRQQVIRAFHRKARRGGHPDTGGDTQTFEEIICARDVLLEKASVGAYEPVRHPPQTDTAPRANPRPNYSPPKETNKLAIVTVVLALLGPFFWPGAIIVGYFALRQIRRTGEGGGILVPIVLFALYVLSFPVLLVLSLMLIP